MTRAPITHPRPRRLLAAALLTATAVMSASAQTSPRDGDLPPGLQDARLLAGWTDAAGDRVLALELVLLPGWKTYWRSPGETGLPPHFAWAGSGNLAGVTLHWPAPQVIRSGDSAEMGYHDRLVLPLTAHARDPGRPVQVAAQIDLGLCDTICVPARLDLTAPLPGTDPDPAITAALAQEPQRLDLLPVCAVTDLPDGVRVAMSLPDMAVDLAAIELSGQAPGGPQIWISGAQIVQGPDGRQAVVEMVGPTAAPFAVEPGDLRLTVVPAGGGRAVDMMGCATPQAG